MAYRTLLPIEKVLDAIGEYKTHRLHFHLGPGAHLLHYPVNSKMVGAALYVHDAEEWPEGAPLTAQGRREDALKAVQGWSEPVSKMVHLFPEKLEKWALFDMFEYPLQQYNWDRIALAGDAAHASSPHHGAGASFGIEDVLCLCTLLDQATALSKTVDKNTALRLAFETYNEVRRCRTQWLVNGSRQTCEVYQLPEWGDPVRRVRAETCFEEVKDRLFKVCYFNSAEMVEQTISNYTKRLRENGFNTEPAPYGTAVNGQAANGSSKPPEIHWLCVIPDRPGVLNARLANLQSHMANTKEQIAKGRLIVGGPSLSPADVKTCDQQLKPTGSVQILRGSSEEEVREALGHDPYAKLGVWDLEHASFQPMRVGVASL